MGEEKNEKQAASGNKLHLALIFFCFIAGFLGAGAFVVTGVIKPNSTTINKTQQKIVSAEGEAISAAYKKVSPSVVSVTTKGIADNGPLGTSTFEGAGTGIIVSSDGYIITNKHVASDAQNITVVGNDGTIYRDVEYVGSDPSNDLAFIKIKNAPKTLSSATLADSSKVEVGQKVIAIGNALGEYQNSVTSGIISGKGRPITAGDGTGQSDEQLDNLFQTDTAINPGNSGGPLLNLNGEVIGINTAIAQDAEGIGFAIPINAAKGLVKTLLASHEVKKAYLGVRYLNITPSVAETFKLPIPKGAYIYDSAGSSVVAGSPADKAGLQNKDIITKINGHDIDTDNGLALLLAAFAPGDKVTLTLQRDGATKTIEVTLGEYAIP
jgi:serine protease Do